MKVNYIIMLHYYTLTHLKTNKKIEEDINLDKPICMLLYGE